MNATQLRTEIQKRFKYARANKIRETGQYASQEFKYWQGYEEALLDLMAEDVKHNLKHKGNA